MADALPFAGGRRLAIGRKMTQESQIGAMAPIDTYFSKNISTLWLCGGTLAISLLFGGNTMTFSSADAIAEAICLPALVASVIRLQAARSGRAPLALKMALLIAGFALVLLMAQLIPLPPSIWMHFPGRQSVVEALRLAEVSPFWLGISLSPLSTRQSLFSLIPALAVFLATVQTNWSERRLLVAFLICFALVSELLGLLQLAQGTGSAARFYNQDASMAGFFANTNHLGVLLYSSALIAGTWGLSLMFEIMKERAQGDPLHKDRVLQAGLLLVAVILLLFGAAFTRSRAAMSLAIVAGGLAFALTWPYAGKRKSFGPVLVFGLAIAAGLSIGANFALDDLIRRVQIGVADSSRADIAQQTWVVIKDYFPIGSGFGTFIPAYASHETAATAVVAAVNRAHNDFLEWLVEGSAAAGAIAALGVLWVIWMNLSAMRRERDPSFADASIRRAAAAVLGLVLVHSTVDYPLRTIAIMAMCAFCAGLCIDPFRARKMSEDGSLRTPTHGNGRRSFQHRLVSIFPKLTGSG